MKSEKFSIENTEWIEAKDFVSGDVALGADGRELVVADVIIDERAETVYNFEVEEYHTYFVGEVGVWVHNEDCSKTQTAEKVLEELEINFDPRVDYSNNLYDDFVDEIKNGITKGVALIKRVPGLGRVA
ncbi:polymorphic toxin-type HINT domain-containing protein [Leptospira jelokensis]|uniref:polymorphic toxin-type HINT domain-containing protein n=1 Tax=Leptospira jelokensis TaxID=2484931 RepID=UPI001091580E|nr:polymorphic toxin-type HINT domain-containing protein [Leptospira jelokensis]TGM06410.1 hypothetical protein EHQ79_00170 [Leptospira jelokensis]